MLPLLRLQQVERTYTGAAAPALHDITLDIHAGEYVAIVGPSGAGKSTLLNVLALLDSPDGGSYAVGGKEMAHASDRQRQQLRSQRFGFVFQHSNALEARTVTKNVEVPLISQSVPFEERGAAIFDALEQANIGHRAQHVARLLSGGERQRMAIARALVGKPQVLFLDEPTGNLDESNARHIFDLLSELNASGVTIVVVTHDAALAAEASRQITVAEGTVVSDTSSLPPQTIEFGRTEIPSATKRRWLRAAIDDVCEAAWSLWDNPGRSLVAILTTAIAVAGLSATVNLSLSASNQVDSLISDAASSNLRVALTDPRMDTFSDDSLLTISAIDGVVAAGRADLYAPADARVGRYAAALPGDPGGVGAVGISGGTFATLDIHIAENVASLFDAPIIGERIAVLGEEAADSLGIIDGVEAVVFVTGVPFDVIAVVNAASLNSDVMISNQAAANLGLQTRQEIIVRTKPGHSSAIADAIPISLDAVSPGRYSVAGAANLAQLRSSVATSFNVLTLVVAAVLLAATIGTIAAMMSSNIRQRHGEIGIRMATGTHRSRIGALFMIEGFVIGLSGAVVGTIAGITIVILASAFQGNAPFFDFLGMLLALAVGVVGGVVAAILPSWRATRIEPAEAIRS